MQNGGIAAALKQSKLLSQSSINDQIPAKIHRFIPQTPTILPPNYRRLFLLSPPSQPPFSRLTASSLSVFVRRSLRSLLLSCPNRLISLPLGCICIFKQRKFQGPHIGLQSESILIAVIVVEQLDGALGNLGFLVLPCVAAPAHINQDFFRLFF